MLNKIKLQLIYLLIKSIFSLLKRIGKTRRQLMSEVGIKETKDAMLFGISLAMAIDESTQDGFQWTDVLSLVPPMTKLPAAIDGITEVPNEIADMDEEERAELVSAIKDLDFVSEGSEEIAEQALRVGVEIGSLILKIREFKK